MMRSIVYVSRAAPSMSNPALLALVTKAQIRNRALLITGRLIYLNRRFVQIIEGPEDGVALVWAAIQRDQTHQDLLLLCDEHVPSRLFPGWTMDFRTASDLSKSEADRLIEVMRLIDDANIAHAAIGAQILDILAGVKVEWAYEILRVPPNQPRARLTVHRMLRSTRMLASRTDDQKLTLEAVAEASHISLPTAYRYFAAPRDLLRMVVRHAQARQWRRFQVGLETAKFENERELANVVADLVVANFEASNSDAGEIRKHLHHTDHFAMFDGFEHLASDVIAAMRRCGAPSDASGTRVRVKMALAAISAACDAGMAPDAPPLPVAEIRASLAATFSAALRG